MRLIIISMAFAVVALAQDVRICQVDENNQLVNKQCIVIPSEAVSALNQFIAAQVSSDKSAKYEGLMDLLAKHITESLVKDVITLYPPPAIVVAKTEKEAAEVKLETAKAAITVVADKP